MIPVEGETQRFFPESARGLVTWLIMYVRVRDGANAHLGTVRDLLNRGGRNRREQSGQRPARHGSARGRDRASAHRQPRRAVHEGKPLQYRHHFDRRHAHKWLLDDRIRADLAKNGIDFATL